MNTSAEQSIEVRPIPLTNLIADVASGRYRIPQFQREFVWSKSKVIELFDSIYGEYPIGSFFLWKAGREHNFLFRHAVELNIPPVKPDDDVSFILDGQQRITSLYVAPRYYREFREEAISEGEFRQIEDRGCPGMGACPL